MRDVEENYNTVYIYNIIYIDFSKLLNPLKIFY